MELLYRDQTEKLIKAAHKVYNTLGYGYQEKEFQKAYAVEVAALGFNSQREVYSDLFYEGVKIRGFFLDFLISVNEIKIIVELKVANKVYQRHFFQVFQYLKNNNLPLGLIIVFTPAGVIVKRVVNLK